ncbi:MAG: amino acid adenylation domain-containing protein, partial [Bacteroidota bacterium]
MKLENFIFELKKRNIEVKVVDGHLKVGIPKRMDASDIIQKIRENKAELIAFIEASRRTQTPYQSIVKASEKLEYCLSSKQQRLFFLHEFDKKSLAYNISTAFELEGVLDIDRLESAFRQLIDRHESLRTIFLMKDMEPVQQIQSEVDFKLEIFDSQYSVQETLDAFIRPFDLEEEIPIRAGLLHLPTGNYLLLMDVHHIVSDGHSNRILVNDLMAFYQGQSLPELSLHYKDYAEWSRSEEQLKRLEAHKSYWMSQFSEEHTLLDLPTDFDRPTKSRHKGALWEFVIGQKEVTQLKQIAESEGVTMYVLLLSIYAIFLSKLSNEEDVVIGTPVVGRQHAELEHVMGMFVNTLPMRIKPDKALSFKAFLRSFKKYVLECFEHQELPYEELVEELQLDRDMSRNPLFDAMFNCDTFEEIKVEIPGFSIKPFSMEHEVSQFDLTLLSVEREGEVLMYFEYDTALFEMATIKQFEGYLRQIIATVNANPAVLLSEISILSELEQKQLLKDFNDTKTDYPKEETIISLFEKQVKETGEKIAIRFEEETLTYQQLDQLANKIATYLVEEKDVQVGDLVGVMMERELYLIPFIFGILKAGAAYVPIDPKFPQERIQTIIDDADLKAFISRNSLLSTKILAIPGFVDLDAALQQITARPDCVLNARYASQNLAYVIYTSGSTGQPKGVMIEHHSLVNRIAWMQKNHPIGTEDVLIQKTPIVFDVSVWELFWWSVTGASLSLLKPGGEKDPEQMTRLIQRDGVTTMHFVPSMLSVFLSDITEDYDYTPLSSLRQVFTSGEALKKEHAHTFGKTIHQHIGTRLINLYGPTEATIDVSYYECQFDDLPSNIPIGKPIDNTALYILDKSNHPAAIGVKGELCIGGVGLARAYLNRPELTDEKFVEHPFIPGERIYRTGDLARWRKDGNIEFLGRIDHQVKVRGHRIELGEIEARMGRHPNITEAVVVVDSHREEQFLCAYYVSDQVLEDAHIRTFLREGLPDYMVPTFYHRMDEMPLTGNGKLNRKALPKIFLNLHTENEYVPPKDAVQLKLTEIWADLLGVEKVGIRDNFFHLGGSSLTAVRLIRQINQQMGANIPLNWIFEVYTIEGLTKKIQKGFTWSAGLDKDYNDTKLAEKVKIADLSYTAGRPSFFFSAPLAGTLPSTSIIGIIDMGPLLKDAANLYGIQPPGMFSEIAEFVNEGKKVDLNEWEFPFAALENIFDQTIQEIKARQGKGPYHLGGFCSGGILAVEAARRLRSEGETVESIVLLDPPRWLTEPVDPSEIKRDYTREEIAKFVVSDIGWSAPMDFDQLLADLKTQPMDAAWRIGIEHLEKYEVLSKRVMPEDLKRSFVNKFFNDKVLAIFFAEQQYKLPPVEEDSLV